MSCFSRISLFLLSTGTLSLPVFAMPVETAMPAANIKQMLGQKLMLDLRYYCAQIPVNGQCRTPMTQLPPELFALIRDYDIGGVILFAENLVDIKQIVQLNRDLQQAAAKSTLKLPLFISIDQEGGRVARLPRMLATSFAGNMAIGATYAEHGTAFSSQVGQVLADELLALGINLNFAPTIDVNVNPDNPVINVRAFGEDATMVAELGGAMTAAMQQQGMIAALKHFPGHGDTEVDSHLGLPRVEHSSEQIRNVDLLPFAQIIKQHNPGMIMTAHIQYPALDNTTFVSKDGETMLKPATLSHKILQGVLRDELGYNGVIVTDALDMAGISKFFSHTEAVVQTFAAGADIALMPVKLQHPAELTALSSLLDALQAAVNDGVIAKQELAASYQRIVALKQQYPLLPAIASADKQVQYAQQLLGSAEHRQAELALAKAALTQVKPSSSTLPFTLKTMKKLLLIMPDTQKGQALAAALQHYSKQRFIIDIISLQQTDLSLAAKKIATADVVISGFISPMQSLADIGGMDDLTGIANIAAAYQRQTLQYEHLLPQIKTQHKPHVFLSLRAPYDITRYGQYADIVLATYAYNTAEDVTAMGAGNATYEALAQALLGQYKLTGTLPVTVAASTN
ncbi:glycosyl hydrolase family 3 [Rheinheimera sp. D18]|uniref:glycoside hydrolase family 3 N-terminal domain-containing protein n=1 Tax=Rheinheimera sp. D18 TaxID=2545632 RepID=UPI0010484E6C|nr:glycoside hydrolase family 3 protein [Rheinheimera sp. D18]QBL10493.1 glycosyl hydrolase family 3 [Rheinheimera sp. D18]